MRQEDSSGEPDSALAEEVDGRSSQGGSMKPNVIIAPSEAFREEVSRQKSEAPPAETDTAQQPPHQAFSDQRLSDVPADTTENLEVSSGSTDETVPPADIQLRADAETSPPSKEWYVAKTALIIVVIALFVGGGAVGMSAWQAYQNSPEKLFDAMLASSMDVHTYRQTRTNIVREASGKKVDIKMTTVFNKDVTDINEPKAKGTLTLEAKKSAANLPYERSGEFIDIDGRTFMQLSDFAHDSSEPGAEIRTKTLEAVKNTWLEADSNAQAIELSDALFGASLDMKRFNTAGGNLVIGNIDESTQRKLLEYREKQKVYAIDKAERTTLEGHQAVKYQIRTSEDKLRKYNAELYPQTSAQGVQEDDPISYAESFVLYVDRSTELPLRLEYSVQGTEVVVEYSNFNQPLAISKPKDAKVASEVVGGLSASQGTGSTSVKDEVDVTQRLDFAQEEVFRGDVFNASIESLKPDSKAQIMLVVGSDYISLGEFTVDGEGILNAEIVIPEDATTGFHELHIYATHPSESRTDFYQFLTVLGSEEDVDGDGIPNETDKCSFVEPADVDEDGDGIDDACDPLIG